MASLPWWACDSGKSPIMTALVVDVFCKYELAISSGMDGTGLRRGDRHEEVLFYCCLLVHQRLCDGSQVLAAFFL